MPSEKRLNLYSDRRCFACDRVEQIAPHTKRGQPCGWPPAFADGV
jgi:hypothetical protein